MCITNPLKISDFQGNLLHMLLFSQKHAFYFSILRIKEGLSHVQQPAFLSVKIYLLTLIRSAPGSTAPEATTSTSLKSSVFVTTVITTAG